MQENPSSAKRTLTEQVRESMVTSSPSSSSPDLSARLRSVAARVRKNVTEGYATPPTFFKSYSTGDIFCSANDTLRTVFSPVPSGPTETIVSPRKRGRPHSDLGYDSDDRIAEDDEDHEMALDEQQCVGISLLPGVTALGRPIKPLRKTPRKGMLVTRSLPNGSMGRPEDKVATDATMSEEEDWSLSDRQILSGCTESFEPMIFS